MRNLQYNVKSTLRIALVAAVVALGNTSSWASETGAHPFAIVERTIVQDQGDWQVDYRLRNDGTAGILVTPEVVTFRVEGWVSNSRAPGHACPRWSSLTASGPAGMQAIGDVIVADDEERRCRERAVLRIWAEDADGKPTCRVPSGDGDGDAGASILNLAPGTTFRVRLRLEHKHIVFGTYDPLLGLRDVELLLGAARFHDVLPMDREQRVAQPPRVVFDVPDDRRDTQFYVSAPDSLHLAAHLPGNAFFRFPEIPVRYGTKMRLRFSYLIADGTQGTCRARITQYKDSPIAWKVLSDGRREVPLTRAGRWTQVELLVRTEPDATTLALDFRIDGDDVEVGELWIDNVSLEPIGAPSVDP